METKKSAPLDHGRKKSKDEKSKTLYFFLGFVFISSVIAFIIGGFFLGNEKSKKQNAATEAKEQIKLSANDIPDNPGEWQSYKLPTFGIEIRLPKNLTKKSEWKEQVIPANKGSIVCFSNNEAQSTTCSGDILIAGGTSADFSDGREEAFTDLQGFHKNNGKIYIKSAGGNNFELSNTKFGEVDNENGLEIIKILGRNSTSEENNLPLPGTPGEGYLGAIVNTSNPDYPGFAIQLKLGDEISELEFDQILRSLKNINQ